MLEMTDDLQVLIFTVGQPKQGYSMPRGYGIAFIVPL